MVDHQEHSKPPHCACEVFSGLQKACWPLNTWQVKDCLTMKHYSTPFSVLDFSSKNGIVFCSVPKLFLLSYVQYTAIDTGD